MKFRFSISRKIALGLGLYTLCVLLLFLFAETTLKRSRAINERINTIYAPSLKMLEELDKQLFKVQQLMKQWAFVQQRADNMERIEALTLCTQRIPDQLAKIDSCATLWTQQQQVLKNVLLADVRALLLAYQDIRELLPDFDSYEKIEAVMAAEDYFIEDTVVPKALGKAQSDLRLLIESQRQIMEEEIVRMNASFSELTQAFIRLVIVLVLIGFFLTFFAIRTIVRPVNSLRHKLNNLSKGIYSLHRTRANNDEIGDMAAAVDRLITNFERTKEFSLSIGAGKFDMQYEPLSEHDELGGALLRMRGDLQSYRNQMEEKVAAQTIEIRNQKEEVERQSERVTELYLDLQASIDYAQRIQSTILPGKEAISELFPNHFVMYRPKATVSGDFYWFANKGKKLMFAAADCTGHGVPGAFMSLVGHNALNQATKVYNKPAQVLNTVNRLSAQALRAHENQMVKDGMDIALCSVDPETMELEFSGAQNPAYVVRHGELIELDGDAFSIGSYVNGEREFSGKKMELQAGDCIYVFSDGYADQFGGPEKKKFMRKQFRQALIDVHSLPMDAQQAELEKRFDEWRGNLEQVDDVLVLGVRV